MSLTVLNRKAIEHTYNLLGNENKHFFLALTKTIVNYQVNKNVKIALKMDNHRLNDMFTNDSQIDNIKSYMISTLYNDNYDLFTYVNNVSSGKHNNFILELGIETNLTEEESLHFIHFLNCAIIVNLVKKIFKVKANIITENSECINDILDNINRSISIELYINNPTLSIKQINELFSTTYSHKVRNLYETIPRERIYEVYKLFNLLSKMI
jgi:hypothetical protein